MELLTPTGQIGRLAGQALARNPEFIGTPAFWIIIAICGLSIIVYLNNKDK